MEKKRPKVLVTRKLPALVENRLRSTYDVRLNTTDQPMRKAELSVAMSNFDALVSTVSDPLDATVLQAGNRRVQLIANVGVGYSNIDTKTAGNERIAVSNTPDVLTDATADIALLLILSATRRAYAAEFNLRLPTLYAAVTRLGGTVKTPTATTHNSPYRFGCRAERSGTGILTKLGENSQKLHSKYKICSHKYL